MFRADLLELSSLIRELIPKEDYSPLAILGWILVRIPPFLLLVGSRWILYCMCKGWIKSRVDLYSWYEHSHVRDLSASEPWEVTISSPGEVQTGGKDLLWSKQKCWQCIQVLWFTNNWPVQKVTIAASYWLMGQWDCFPAESAAETNLLLVL